MMTSRFADIDWILWSGTVGLEKPIPERVEAAVAAEFTSISVSPLDIHRAEQAGTAAKEVGRFIRDRGLRIIVDPVMNWHPFSGTAGSRFSAFSAEQSLRWVEVLEAVSLTAVAMDDSDVPVEALGEPFGRLSDRAADVGAQVHLEFMPISCVATLRAAWNIVRAADRTNGGIVFDTWHFFRSDPDYDLLATVPGERILCVQIDDAAAAPRASLREDTRNRLLPGDGDLDLARVVRALAEIDALRWVGPEVISPMLEAMPEVEAAQLAGGKTRELVATALAAT
jgi:sugar phosphate isomerase/epimerase